MYIRFFCIARLLTTPPLQEALSRLSSNSNLRVKSSLKKLTSEVKKGNTRFENVVSIAQQMHVSGIRPVAEGTPSRLVQEQETIQRNQLKSRVEVNEYLIREREEEIREINTMALGVNEMMKDLAVMVDAQGETLVNVHDNVQDAAEKTKKGVQELYKADEYQQSNNCVVC